MPPQPAVSEDKRRQFDVFHQPTARVYSAVLPGEIVRQCVNATSTGQIDPADLLGIDHLVVDEYQDLNPADLEFVDQLASRGVRVFVAGDDDQSIYSFRHASPLGIQRFTEKYPQAAAHELRHCFRCTPEILHAATHVILNNASPSRIAKALVSLYENADPPNRGVVHRWRFLNAHQEAAAIANSCARLITGGLPPKQILILLANRRVLWPGLQQALAEAGVPFDPPREEGFSDSRIGRLVLALCRIVGSRDEDGNAEDLIAHRTLLGLRRGAGVGTCNGIRATVITAQNVNFRQLFYGDLPDGVFGGRALTALNHARGVCEAIANWQPNDTVGQRRNQIADFARSALDDAAAEEWVGFSEPLPTDMRLSELRDYVWVDNAQQRAEVLAAVRRRLELPEEEAGVLDRVRVMSMHGAKGLSARVVFIPGLENGVIPNRRQLPYPAQLLEAARLLYVSITRARAACILSFARRRFINGQTQAQAPSTFTGHTGGAFVEADDEGLTAAQTARINQTIQDL